ncbi:MAG: radical SAM protein [Chloroflexi bacterium]|nr:radical SAM protein [Chloroflexota bacterium]
MRVAIVYPPFRKNGHYALLGQNRQFRFSASNLVRIFPLVPATAATLLKNDRHEVLFLDGINLRLSRQKFWQRLVSFNPDLVVMETKTPVIQRHWEVGADLKAVCQTRVVLVGDHVTVFPEESLLSGSVDYCIAGGDYDLALQGLVRHLQDGASMPSGVYFVDGGKVRDSGPFQLASNLDDLPYIDRDLTGWQHYGEAYLYHPTAYILSGRGCGIDKRRAGSCTFCVWQHTLWRRTARLRSPENVVGEIRQLVDTYKVKEIFDDNEAGPFWDRDWLREFAREMSRSGLVGRVRLSANARADALDDEVCYLLAASGFRLLKVGLESGCDVTLQHLGKEETRSRIAHGVKTAKDHGLSVMLTTMVGYPWETDEEVAETYNLVRDLMLYKTRLGDALQASVMIPYPGTPLHSQANQKGWLTVAPQAYERFDMSVPVLRTTIDASRWCRRMWRVHQEPSFLLKTLVSIRSSDDLSLLWRGMRSLMGNLRDYTNAEN